MNSMLNFVAFAANATPAVVAFIGVIVSALMSVAAFKKQRKSIESEEKIREIIDKDRGGSAGRSNKEKSDRLIQNVLIETYHEQSLSQSRVSFWFSIIFAALGFAIIASSIVVFLQNSSQSNLIDKAAAPVFTLIAGAIIDAVAALFFVQSNRSRQLMVDFFDKLRIDRKLDEALALIREIPDPVISSRIRGVIALNFSEVPLDRVVLAEMLHDVPVGGVQKKSEASGESKG